MDDLVRTIQNDDAIGVPDSERALVIGDAHGRAVMQPFHLIRLRRLAVELEHLIEMRKEHKTHDLTIGRFDLDIVC